MNEVDRRHRARTASAQLAEAAHDEALELGPQLVGALEGLAAEFRDQRHVTERMICALDRLDLTCRGLTDEIAALRVQRVGTINGRTSDNLMETDP